MGNFGANIHAIFGAGYNAIAQPDGIENYGRAGLQRNHPLRRVIG
jgi:hypothetical protein